MRDKRGRVQYRGKKYCMIDILLRRTAEVAGVLFQCEKGKKATTDWPSDRPTGLYPDPVCWSYISPCVIVALDILPYGNCEPLVPRRPQEVGHAIVARHSVRAQLREGCRIPEPAAQQSSNRLD